MPTYEILQNMKRLDEIDAPTGRDALRAYLSEHPYIRTEEIPGKKTKRIMSDVENGIIRAVLKAGMQATDDD